MKHVFAIIVLFVSLSVSAQQKPEKKAQKFTDEMTEVLSLNKEESKAIYEIQLERFKENQAINEEFADNQEMKKEKLKELGNKVFNQTKKVLGEDRQKQWKDYKSKTK
jgi:hypothetical protein